MRREDQLLQKIVENVRPELTPRQMKALKKLKKYDFFVYEEGEYHLTERGREASRIGAKNFLKLEKLNQGTRSEKKWLRRSLLISLFFLLLLSLYIFYLLFRNTHAITS